MRVGSNPEKFKKELTRIWSHRVIIPVYIPSTYEDFFNEAFDSTLVTHDGSLLIDMNGQISMPSLAVQLKL